MAISQVSLSILKLTAVFCGGRSPFTMQERILLQFCIKSWERARSFWPPAVPGSRLDVLTHLGNGFDPGVRCKRPLLIGGGIGCPPLYLLAKELRASGKTPAVLLGFNAPSEVLLEQEFKALVPEVTVVTQGYVTDSPVFTSGAYDYLYTCGPLPMLKAVYSGSRCGGQYSFEERMGCGFGACMGCSCRTKYGSKRICKDGPVLYREEIVW